MKTKVKTGVIISIMCLVALCSIIAIIAVFAANTQTFNSNVTVNYKAPGIIGKVSSNYYVGSQDEDGTSMTTNGKDDGEKELVFNDSPESSNGTLNPQGNIQLTSTNRFVVFEYVFQNGLGEPIPTDYLATLSLNTTSAKNVKMKIKQSEQKLTDFNQIVTEVVTTTGNNKGWVVVEHNEEDNYIATKYFYVKVEIDVVGKDASFSGNFNWELNLTKPSLDKLTFSLVGDDHYSVALTKPATSSNIIIPKTYTGEDGIKKPVTEIAASGFSSYKTNGNILYIPEGVTKIGDNAFTNCGSLGNELFLPESLTEIGKTAFEKCTIQSFILGENLATIDESAFKDASFQSLIETANTSKYYFSAFSGDFYDGVYHKVNIETEIIGGNVTNASINGRPKNIVVDAANKKYASRDNSGKECNVLIEKNSKTIIKGSDNSIIPTDNSVTTIGEQAFSSVTIQTLVVPDNIPIIGELAFANADIQKLVLSGVVEIKDNAFYNAYITTIQFGPKLSSISYNTFYECTNTEELIIDGQIACENILSWDPGVTGMGLSKIKAKYKITGISSNYRISSSQDSDGYWVYTHSY